MQLKTVLELKDPDIFSIGANSTVADCARLFKEKQIGFALVEQAGKTLGTISERDIIHALAKLDGEVATQPVTKIMTTKIVNCPLDTDINEVRSIMTKKRTRHVLVMDEGALMGVVSIGDVVKHSLDECQIDGEALREYIGGQGYQ